MVASRTDYVAEAVSAAHSVMLELIHLLGEYRNDIVVIGGWVPFLLLADASVEHIGSMDVDLALNHRTLQDSGYRTIQQLLVDRGYRQGKQPFTFYRPVQAHGREIIVQVDLLAGEYAGAGRKHRTQPIQDVRARKARGCDLAFDIATEVTIEGSLPEGGQDSATVRVASMVPFIVMKGIALADRLKAKDAWDIYFCTRYYPGGLEALVEEFLPHQGHGLVREGLEDIAGAFASPEHTGPQFVADFEELTDPEERALLQRDAYERVRYLIERLDVKSDQGTI